MLRDTWACPGSEDKPAQGPWCGVLGVTRKLQPFVVAPVWAMSEVRLRGGMGRGQTGGLWSSLRRLQGADFGIGTCPLGSPSISFSCVSKGT